VIRGAAAGDAPTIARIYVESWNAGFGSLMPRRELDSELVARWRSDLGAPLPQRWWLATRDDSAVGFAGIGPSRDPIDPGLGELDTIAVAVSQWRTGVGRALMAHALQHLAADGYREALLWTLASYPRGAAFYESMGWRSNGAVRAEGRQVCYTHSLR
jgi:GNAT superfamily N-acetyltransferase